MEIQAAVVFRDALVGLKIMHHDMNRVHRDLKPANIGVLGTRPVPFFWTSAHPPISNQALCYNPRQAMAVRSIISPLRSSRSNMALRSTSGPWVLSCTS